MPVLLCGIGVLALVAGLAMVGFGIPINEFSFGNTLINAGTTAIIGGLIIIALGITVRQLRRIVEALAHQSPVAPAQHDMPESMGPAVTPRAPQPSRPRIEPPASPLTAGPPMSSVNSGNGRNDTGNYGRDTGRNTERNTDRNTDLPPMLHNPEAPLEHEVTLSPHYPTNSGAQPVGDRGGRPRSPAPPPFGAPAQDLDERETPPGRLSPASSPQARPQQAARFDSMWPAEAKSARSPAESKPNAADASSPLAPQKRGDAEPQRPQAVAILKSGVVDGMSYTLYVDGSIEAELPQGTLRFASITDLRNHLEKNS